MNWDIPTERQFGSTGHDAQFASVYAPTTIISCTVQDGHSHCEEEFTPVEQCTKGASVLLNTVLKCDKED